MQKPLIPVVELGAQRVGGLMRLAELLGIKHNSMYDWTAVPPGRCLKFSEVTSIPLHHIRPDIYPDPSK